MTPPPPRRSTRLNAPGRAQPAPVADLPFVRVGLPSVYQEMLAEATASTPQRPPKRPVKRRRVDSPPNLASGDNSAAAGPSSSTQTPPASCLKVSLPTRSATQNLDETEASKQKRLLRDVPQMHGPSFPPRPLFSNGRLEDLDDDDDDDEDLDFEDVNLPNPVLQTIVRDFDDESSDDSSDDDDDDDEAQVDFQNIDFENLTQATASAPSTEIQLNLTAQQSTLDITAKTQQRPRCKPLTKEQKQHRLETHQMHLLCLIWHCSIRNYWCNQRKVQHAVKKHLTKRTRDYLCPKKTMLEFAQTESIKRGLDMAGKAWNINYRVTERGMKRALWAATPEELTEYQPPDDLETCTDLADFNSSANRMAGSRDVGAQLYCAFLRAAGIRTRLVCSLQVLGFGAGGPPMAVPKPKVSKAQIRKQEMDEKKRRAMDLYKKQQEEPESAMAAIVHRRRAMGTRPVVSPTPQPRTPLQPQQIKESAYPVYWVEVLDKASSRWIPADPLATQTFARTKALEPPLNDRDNIMTYVIAFDENGSFRDVTNRYTKMFKTKTRKLRIEHGLPGGSEWWKRVIKLYTKPRRYPSKLQLIEDEELKDYLAREPMPKNISDFMGHPEYVLERHLRRNEVLKPGSRLCGTIRAGNRAPIERVYPRWDVRVVHSREKWFRLGRQVRPTEYPSKILQRRIRKGQDSGEDGEPEPHTTIPVYTEEQTDLFQHPPVVAGRVPRNKFGNLEIYTQSMVPAGGTYIAHNKAVKAAFLLGIDYAPAVSGFEFRGRHGTAVMKGAVVAAEYEEAMLAVVEGFDDMLAEAFEEKKRKIILKAWSRLLMGLRIRAKIWKGVDVKKEEREAEERAFDQKQEEERQKKTEMVEVDKWAEETREDVLCEAPEEEVYEFEMDDEDEESVDDEMGEAGGGFMLDDDDDDDDMEGGGFVIE